MDLKSLIDLKSKIASCASAMKKKMTGYGHLPFFLRELAQESVDALERSDVALEELIQIKNREINNKENQAKRLFERAELVNLIKTEIRYIKNRKVLRSPDNSADIDDLNDHSLTLIENMVSKLDKV